MSLVIEYKRPVFITVLVLFHFLKVIGNVPDNNPNENQQALVDSLNAESSSNWYSNPDETIKLGERALSISRETGYRRGEAEALNNIGVGYYFSSDYDKVLDYYKRTLDKYEELGDEDGMTRVGTLYFRIAKYEKALESYKEGLEVARKNGDRENVIKLIANIADVYRNLGNFEEALQWYDNLLYNEELRGNERGEAIAIEQIATIHFSRGNYEKALEKFNHLYKINENMNSKPGMASALNQIGITYHLLKKYEKALNNYNLSVDLQKEIGDEFGLATNYLNIGKLLFTTGKLSEGRKWIEDGISLARKQEERGLLKDGLKLLAIVLYDLGDHEEAFKLQLEYSSIIEKQSIREKNEQLTNTLVLYELGQKKQDNEILLTRNENYRLNLEKQSLSKWRIIMGFTIVLVLIAIAIIYYGYRIKRREIFKLGVEVEQAVMKQEEQQKIIFHQSSLTSLGELAAGIAHEINQPMQNISLSAEAVNEELKVGKTDKSFLRKTVLGMFDDIERVRGIVDHIRLFSSGQKEEVYEHFSPDEVILEALKMVRQQMVNSGIVLIENLNAKEVNLEGNPHKFEQVILNILSNARDAVNAIDKTGRAKQIEIVTGIADNEIMVSIKDNGSGIEKEKLTDIFLPFFTTKKLGQGTGLGLSIAHGIISQMGGRIVPESKIGEGTEMNIYFPDKKQ